MNAGRGFASSPYPILLQQLGSGSVAASCPFAVADHISGAATCASQVWTCRVRKRWFERAVVQAEDTAAEVSNSEETGGPAGVCRTRQLTAL